MRKVLLGLFLATPCLLLAQGSQVNTQSQKLIGMAGAGTSLFIDESSIAYNPGALAKMEYNGVQIGSSAIMFRSAFREAGTAETFNNRFQISPPPAIYATFGPNGSWWKAGIGVYTPFGGGVDWGTDWPGRYSLSSLSLRAFYIQPTLSFKLTENFSFGGGFIYNIGFVDLGRALPAYHPDGRPATVGLSGTGTGIGYNLGFHYHLEDRFALSVSYRSKVVTMLEDGDVTFDIPGAIAGRFPNTTFNSELPLPSTLNVGVSFPLGSKLDMAIDGTITNYSIYETLAFDYAAVQIADTKSIKAYENAFSGKVGLNYQTNEKLALRVGAAYILTPVQSGYVYPETPDNKRLVLAGGVTYELSPKWELNGSYAFQHIMARTTTNIESGLRGTYETFVHAPGLSLTYKW